jgi:hypothetical protein
MLKNEVYQFLEELYQGLNENLPQRTDVHQLISAIINNRKDYKVSDWQDAFAILLAPIIYKLLSRKGMGDDGAREAFLSEMHGQKKIAKLVGGRVARFEGHPFTKNDIGIKPDAIIDRWRGLKKGRPCPKPCPDMAFRFPCKVDFEVKYFRQNQSGSADSELVKGIYEAFFYRSLPFIPETPGRAAWDYDYSCFLAYDATVEGNLLKAWDSLDKNVKKGFWDGANIYVMILRSRK